MKSNSLVADPVALVWDRVVDFERELSPTAARALLRIQISAREHANMSNLMEEARTRKLSAAEEQELDAYEKLGCLLGIVHSKARQALKKTVADA